MYLLALLGRLLVTATRPVSRFSTAIRHIRGAYPLGVPLVRQND